MHPNPKCQKNHHHHKHCSSLCCKISKLNTNLNNILQRIEPFSPITKIKQFLPLSPTHPLSPPSQQRHIPSQYLKVTETVNNIIGVQEVEIKKHHTDGTEMVKALRWDDKQETQRVRREESSRVIKLRVDRKREELERIRKKGEEKEWEKGFRSVGVYQDGKGERGWEGGGESPRFDNEYLKKKTEENELLQSKRARKQIHQQSKYPTKDLLDKNLKERKLYQTNKSHKYIFPPQTNQYSYKKTITTRFRYQNDSNSSTDSQFSRFHL